METLSCKNILMVECLQDSDPILRIRALQYICANHFLYPSKNRLISTLIERLKIETHPKVIRWIAYTLAILKADFYALNAINKKCRVVNDPLVNEWLIASAEKISINQQIPNKPAPEELNSNIDFHIGVVKSWAYESLPKEFNKKLIEALNSPNPATRRWAVLSLGAKKINSPYLKDAIKSTFDDDDFLVREWAMYALKDVADENDILAYSRRLEIESHVRAREWAVKSLPHTQSRLVPDILLPEVNNEFFINDSLYAEAVITTLGFYADRKEIRDKLLSVLTSSNDDLILLACVAPLLKVTKNIEERSEFLSFTYKRASNMSTRRQIGFEMVNLLNQQERNLLRHLIVNPSKREIFQTILSEDLDCAFRLLNDSSTSCINNRGIGEKLDLEQITKKDSEMPAEFMNEDYDQWLEEQSWFPPNEPKFNPIDLIRLETIKKNIDVLIVTATESELKAILNLLIPLKRFKSILKGFVGPETYYLGRFGLYNSAIFKCRMGAVGQGSAALSVCDAVDYWLPKATIMVGVAFGKDSEKQRIGDVLVASNIIPYEKQRVGTQKIFRGDIPPCDPTLLNRFENALDWKFSIGINSFSKIKSGPVLSGEKLVDDPEFKQGLFEQFPEAIGGEMEGAGLCAATGRLRAAWLLVKTICDWADGNKNKRYQVLAAACSSSLVHHVLSEKNVFQAVARPPR